ncbi:hypothetical protein [Ancylobacter polymorphus]|uniref:Uncharacterized protein n=1 Tax=Ancylobacter polymorphus TaxID=223390 RepID=A0ABU0BDB3_9HYPH|nr:hypothetical protein [Ancylobacter polymorphus]MDQ0303828.1 hypothetical protein [Ancylobacter polymorphus]
MNSITDICDQIRDNGYRNEARLALGEAAFAAATVRRLTVYAMTIMSGDVSPVMAGDIKEMRRALADASAALDKMSAPAQPRFLEAAE